MRFPNVRLVVFDLDGTLVDAFEDITNAVNHALRRLHRPEMTVDEVKPHVGRGVRSLVASVLNSLDDELIEDSQKALVEYYSHRAAEHARLYEGVAEVLEELHGRGMKLAVASNKPDGLTHTIVEELGVARFFDFISGESAAFPRKPAPDMLHHIMEQAGAERAETLVVGDSSFDIDFARAAGVSVAVVTYGQTPEAELREFEPDAVMNTMTELPNLLPGSKIREDT